MTPHGNVSHATANTLELFSASEDPVLYPTLSRQHNAISTSWLHMTRFQRKDTVYCPIKTGSGSSLLCRDGHPNQSNFIKYHMYLSKSNMQPVGFQPKTLTPIEVWSNFPSPSSKSEPIRNLNLKSQKSDHWLSTWHKCFEDCNRIWNKDAYPTWPRKQPLRKPSRLMNKIVVVKRWNCTACNCSSARM